MPVSSLYRLRRLLLAGGLVACLLAGPAHAGVPDSAAVVREDRGPVDVRVPPGDVLAPYRADPDFQYDRAAAPPETWWDRLVRWFLETLMVPLASPALAPWRRALFYLVVGAVVVFAVLRLLRMEARGLWRRAPAASVHPAAGAEDVHAIDFEARLREAVAAGDYRRAVRLCYLRALKELADAGLIVWRIDKTNDAYVDELAAPALRPAFAHLTQLYDYVWYGGFPLDASRFAAMRDAFAAFHRQIAEGR